MERILTAILGGGQGARLWPLTKYRSKPAVPVAGKFRLIDIAISNSLHAGIDRIYVLTQFNSASLHRHIAQTYRFDVFSRGFVNILAAEQSVENRDWYQGTADAVRQNLPRLIYARPTEVLVLSGDQLYRMNLRRFVSRHRESQADISVAVSAMPSERAGSFGVMKVDDSGRIVHFLEKPKDPAAIEEMTVSPEVLAKLGFEPKSGQCLVSMGIYVFQPDVLQELLKGTSATDFGHEVIPAALSDHRVFAFGYPGYWRDIGTIRAFHEANLELTLPLPPLDLYSPDEPFYTHARFLPGTKITDCSVHQSLISEGCIVSGASLSQSVIGIRSVVREGTVVEDSVIMGANRYDWEEPDTGVAKVGIGRNCTVRRAIIDLDARIGDGVQLVNAAGIGDSEAENYSIRDGVIVVPRGAEIPAGTVI